MSNNDSEDDYQDYLDYYDSYHGLNDTSSDDESINNMAINTMNLSIIRIQFSDSVNVLNEVDAIATGFLYEYADLYKLNNVYDINGTKLETMRELFGLLNYILHDIFDLLIKSKLLDDAIVDKFKYAIFGGKAFERLFNQSYDYVESFDFDIVLEEPDYKIISFARILTILMNSHINYQYGSVRQFIKNLLVKYNLIDKECYEHYDNLDNDLIYYGTRLSSNNTTKLGIFVHLKFRKDLFFDNKTAMDNIIYYPLIDLVKTSDIVYTVNVIDLPYASLPVSLFGYISALVKNVKFDKNLARIRILDKPDAYLCNPAFFFPTNDKFIDEHYQLDKLTVGALDVEDIDKLIKDNDIDFDGEYTNVESFLQYLIDKYYNTYKSKVLPLHNNCENYFNTVEKPYVDSVNSGESLQKIFEIVKKIDQTNGGGIYYYTTDGHRNINLYKQLQNLNLLKNYSHLFSQTVDTYKVLDMKIDFSISTLVGNSEYESLVNQLFRQNFSVYSSQTFLYFNSNHGKISDVDSLSQSIGSIIYMPNYLSTTYEVSPKFYNFIHPMKIIYKINIDNSKNIEKNWVIVGKYSKIHDENELLINAESYFVIEDVSYIPVVKMGWSFNVKLITMRLCNNYNHAVQYASSFSEQIELIGRFDGLKGGATVKNSNTIMIDPEWLGYNPTNYNELFTAYFDIYYQLSKGDTAKTKDDMLMYKPSISMENYNYEPVLVGGYEYQKYLKYKTKYYKLLSKAKL